MKAKNQRLGLVLGLLLATPLATSYTFAQEGPPPDPHGEGVEAGPGPVEPKEGKKHRRERPDNAGPGADMMNPRVLQRILTPEELETYMAAQKKAMEDPRLVAKREALEKAHKEFAEAREAALLKADPAMAAILEKIKEARKNMGDRRGPGAGKDKPGKPEGAGDPPPGGADPGANAGKPGANDLTKEELELRQNLRQAMNNANPETAALLENMQEEKTPANALN